jgi:hypothetical protein
MLLATETQRHRDDFLCVFADVLITFKKNAAEAAASG